jgi:poly(A) polymerase
MRIHLLAQAGRLPSRKAVYHFFRDTGGVGVEVVLLTLADTLATYGASLDVDTWQKHLEVSRELLECWWEKPEVSVNPPILLNGYDLQNELGLTPGPKIGELLANIREAQAEGKIQTRDQAMEMARAWITNQSGN